MMLIWTLPFLERVLDRILPANLTYADVHKEFMWVHEP